MTKSNKWKRWLYLSHRWIGIALCLLFSAWFISGIVMMYVDFPQLDRAERLAGLPPLDFSSARLTPTAAIARLHESDFATIGTPTKNLSREIANPEGAVVPTTLQLGMLFDRPLYRIKANEAQPIVIFADTGEILKDVTPELATHAVKTFVQRANKNHDTFLPTYVESAQTDQWTLSSGLNAHRPLHRVALNDAEGHEYYVSSSTGEVVRDTSRNERALNYVGAVTHWIYPTVIRRYPEFWAWVVDIVASVGVVLAFSGMWIGVLRWKFQRRPGKPAVPYRGLMRWHYFAGIFFGITTLTWVFSGWMSMNPGGLNPPRSPSPLQSAVISGIDQSLRMQDFDTRAPAFLADTVEGELLHFAGHAFYLATRSDGSRYLVNVANGAIATIDPQQLIAMAPQLMPEASVHSAKILNAYDNYYYSRHPERSEKPLPILRVEFNDEANTWFHIDVLTGRILERSTATNRIYRWIYNGLHSWDIWWLWQHRPLWDIAVISFSLGGLALSLLGVMVGWRRLNFRSSNSSSRRSNLHIIFSPRRNHTNK